MTDLVTEALFPEWDERLAHDAASLRREGVRRVEQHATREWLSAARHAGVLVAKRRAEFTTDPIWKVLELQGVRAPHEPRAMGPVMNALVRAGVCRKTDRVRESVRPECHQRPLAVYASLVYPGVK